MRHPNAIHQIEVRPGQPINQYPSGILEYFGNTTPGGMLIQGYDTVQSLNVGELATQIEDSLLASLL